MRRDSLTRSIWQEEPSIKVKRTGPDSEFDVIIVGGGITGISTGLKLQQKGINCLIVEPNNVGYGTTSGTSAHLNTVLDNPYTDIIDKFGLENAKHVAINAKKAIRLIKENIKKYQIDCDIEDKKGYLFAEDEDEAKTLDKIKESIDSVGVGAIYVNEIPVPVPFINAISFKNQGQFNPIKYLNGILKAYLEAGGEIVENAKFINYEKVEDEINVETSIGNFNCDHLVFATHIPPGLNILHFRCAPYRSYVIGMKLKNEADYPDAVVYDSQEPFHYFRTAEGKSGKYLLVGGNDHKTGHKENDEDNFDDLIKYCKKYYQIGKVTHKWSAQYYEPADTLPYIGKLPGKDQVYVATGFSGNGMIWSTLSAEIIRDLIFEKDSKLAKIVDPGRIKPIAGMVNIVQENIDVAKHFIMDRFNTEDIQSLTMLETDEGMMVDYEGRKVAVYRDKNSKVHALNPVCPHAKCIVQWNKTEKSWDCPCHGARFDVDGKLLNGPAISDLEKIDI